MYTIVLSLTALVATVVESCTETWMVADMKFGLTVKQVWSVERLRQTAQALERFRQSKA